MPEMRELLNDGRVHLVQGSDVSTGVWRRLLVATSRDLCVERRDGRRVAQGWQHCWQENTLEKIVEFGKICRNETIAVSMYSPKLVNEALRALGKQLVDDGRLDSVSLYSAGPTADFPELDTREWQEDDYDQHGNLLDPIKVKEGKSEEIEWVLKQKLFDYVPQSECAERQGRPYSLKWVLKNKGEKVRARLVVREIKKAKSENEKLLNRVICSLQCRQWRA